MPVPMSRTLLIALLALPIAPGAVHAKCHITQFPLLVTMNGTTPLVAAGIDGKPAQFLADSGSSFSMISPAAAERYRLRSEPVDMRIWGVGGGSGASLATVSRLTLGAAQIANVQFIVAGNTLGSGVVGVLGENLLGTFDTEYDLANGIIRLMRPSDCKNADFAYWAPGQPHSVIDLDRGTPGQSQPIGRAQVNGSDIRVLFDTGASMSILRLQAAERAGIRPIDPGVVPAGPVYGGIGSRAPQSWIAPVASFRIGGEEVRNTRLRIGDIELQDADMLLGADFFLSHHIYVAASQEKLYFTYNGGPVFNLTAVARTGSAAGSPTGEPTDAAGFSRRGTAFAARREFERAIADLTRACELAPGEAPYFYQRGRAYAASGQAEPALADFAQALKLKPDDVETLMARAALRRQGADFAGATADLEAADRSLAREAPERLPLGELYLSAGQFAAAVRAFDQWIDAHAHDALMGYARNGRCRALAFLGQDLDKALKDCGAALRQDPNDAGFLESRGLVRLRLGDLDGARADYDAALRLRPDSAWSLYGRGIARVRKGDTAGGRADIAAAAVLQPHIAEEANRRGITP